MLIGIVRVQILVLLKANTFQIYIKNHFVDKNEKFYLADTYYDLKNISSQVMTMKPAAISWKESNNHSLLIAPLRP